MTEPSADTPVEVEVERLPANSGGVQNHESHEDSEPKAAQVGNIVGPVLAGVAIDLVDLATPFPLVGFLVGWPLGAYIARQAGAPGNVALKLGFFAGLYCAVPMTAGLPIGTLIGTMVKVQRAMA